MKIVELDQNSEEWLEYRKGKSGGSAFGKFRCNDSFSVAKLTYRKNGDIDGLAIRNNKTGNVVFAKMPKEKNNE